MYTTDRGRLLRIYPVLQELPPDLLGPVAETAKPVEALAGLRVFDGGGPGAPDPRRVEGRLRVARSRPAGGALGGARCPGGDSWGM